jgi:eukaryotic-like serine/threonine-protein kinase
MSDLAGTTLHERYFLREKVGAGGMADVYLAWDNMRSTRMAVKVLRRDLAQDPRFYQMFAKEAELLRQLEHPNIVRLYEFGSQDEIAFIIMDWVEGSNLHQTITERKAPLGLDEVAWVLDGICPALGFAHQNNVFHCDIKPANIMLHVDGRVLLTDFGVARLAQDQALGGTPTYMAPEQFAEDNEVSVRTDIYSLGITLYEMLSGGKLPFRGETASSQGSTVRDRIAWEHRNLPPPPLNNTIRICHPQSNR